MKNEGRQIIEVNPLYLMEHSVLENIPRLAPDQLESLRESIARRGLMEPLDVVPNPEHEGAYLIIDGRHRFEILRKANQPIPCIVHAEKDPLDFAIDKAVQGRQLTKSGVVLMLFLNHPDLADKRARALRTKAGVEPPERFRTFSSLAEKYRVPPEYFYALAEIKDHADEEKWEVAKHKILVDEICIPRVRSAMEGAELTKGKKRADTNFARIAVVYPGSLKSVFEKWGKFKWSGQYAEETAAAKFREAYAVLPEAHRGWIQECMPTWPVHERKAAIKALTESLKCSAKKV
jgi:hypothetical protein